MGVASTLHPISHFPDEKVSLQHLAQGLPAAGGSAGLRTLFWLDNKLRGSGDRLQSTRHI